MRDATIVILLMQSLGIKLLACMDTVFRNRCTTVNHVLLDLTPLLLFRFAITIHSLPASLAIFILRLPVRGLLSVVFEAGRRRGRPSRHHRRFSRIVHCVGHFVSQRELDVRHFDLALAHG